MFDIQKVSALSSAVVAALKDKAKDAKVAGDDGRKALDNLRALAVVTAEGNEAQRETVANLLHAQLMGAGFSKGTADPYRVSFRGFTRAVADGVTLTAYRNDSKGKPVAMTAAEARTYWQRANETPEEKAGREAKEKRDAMVAEIVERLKVADGDTLAEIHETVLAMVSMPEATVEAPAAEETAAQKAMREAAELLAKLEASATVEPVQPTDVVAREA